MYLKYFGMRVFPFSLTPDTSFFYSYGHFLDAYNVLQVALHSGEGFIKITGEVGTGKTLLCRKLLNSLGQEYITAYIPNPMLTASGVYKAVLEELEIGYPHNASWHLMVKLIIQKLVKLNAMGKTMVLIVDEAQTLPHECLEAIRLLSNIETEKYKLLHVILFGQPELNTNLNQPETRQLKQRIAFSYQLQRLDRAGIDGYIAHRLMVSGYQGRPLFDQRALNNIYRASRGIPRLVNILCHKSLMLAYGRGLANISRKITKIAVADTEAVQSIPHSMRPEFVYSILGTIALVVAYYFQNALL